MKVKRKTVDAVQILKRRVAEDRELREIYEEEKVNYQAALAIRKAREAAGLTQAELAKKVGTTQSAISRLEDADYEGHTIKMLERIAEVLKRRGVISLRPAAPRGAEGGKGDTNTYRVFHGAQVGFRGNAGWTGNARTTAKSQLSSARNRMRQPSAALFEGSRRKVSSWARVSAA